MPSYLPEATAKVALQGGVLIVATWSITGASGAVNSYAGSSPGISVALKNASTGTYTITLPRGYKDLFLLEGVVNQADNATLLSVSESQTQYTPGALTFEVRTKVNAGTLTNPASGDRIVCLLWANERGVIPVRA